MTSRTTPVGILVIALVSLIAVGCSAPTNAVFQALLDPAGTAVSSPEAGPAVDDAADGGDVAVWWPHPDGYAMILPAGWTGMAVDHDGTDELVNGVSRTMPELGARMSEVLQNSQSRVSAIAFDRTATDDTSLLLVLAQPTNGRKAHAIKTDVRQYIQDLPGRSGDMSAHDVVLPTAKGVRFDYTVVDPDLGELRVFSYLFRFGRTAYLVSFVASPDAAGDAETTFYTIADSLRFGV